MTYDHEGTRLSSATPEKVDATYLELNQWIKLILRSSDSVVMPMFELSDLLYRRALTGNIVAFEELENLNLQMKLLSEKISSKSTEFISEKGYLGFDNLSL